jgi:hypothetical protein
MPANAAAALRARQASAIRAKTLPNAPEGVGAEVIEIVDMALILNVVGIDRRRQYGLWLLIGPTNVFKVSYS